MILDRSLILIEKKHVAVVRSCIDCKKIRFRGFDPHKRLWISRTTKSPNVCSHQIPFSTGSIRILESIHSQWTFIAVEAGFAISTVTIRLEAIDTTIHAVSGPKSYSPKSDAPKSRPSRAVERCAVNLAVQNPSRQSSRLRFLVWFGRHLVMGLGNC